MRVDFGNKTYSVGFRYLLTVVNEYNVTTTYKGKDAFKIPNMVAKITSKKLETSCIIELKDGDKYIKLAEGSVVKHASDRADKRVARKAALTKALTRFPTKLAQNNNQDEPRKFLGNMNFRREVWKQYFLTHKEGKKIIESLKRRKEKLLTQEV